jgi:hypothetical protein
MHGLLWDVKNDPRIRSHFLALDYKDNFASSISNLQLCTFTEVTPVLIFFGAVSPVKNQV